jgi:TolB protein
VLSDRILFEGEGVVRATSIDGLQRFIVPTGPDLSGAYTPAVSPDGRRIAFSGIRLGQVDLYVMHADGTGRRQLTNDAGLEFYPRWSPDGSSLLFTWNPTPNNPPTLMVIMDPNGRNRRDVLTDGWAGDWSPDGRSIAFTGTGARGRGIYVLDIGGGTVTSLPDVCGSICEGIAPRWSPDGQYLAFTYLRPVGGNSVVLARPNGADARTLLPEWETFSPVWAPDGQRLALARFESSARMYLVSLATMETVSLSPAEANEFPSDWAP